MSLSAAERELFLSSARSALAGVWPSATSAADAGAGPDAAGPDGAGLIGRVWDLAAEYGWFELGEAGDLQTALALAAELGRAACPLPVLDGFAAVRLARRRPRPPMCWCCPGSAARSA